MPKPPSPVPAKKTPKRLRFADIPKLNGVYKQRRVSRKGQTGTLVLWDTHKECLDGIEAGPNRERWCLVHHVAGRGDAAEDGGETPRQMHFPNQRTALAALKTLAATNEPDEWRFFAPGRQQSVLEASPANTPDLTGGQLARHGVVASPSLARLLQEKFPEEYLANKLADLLEAEQTIYVEGIAVGKEPAHKIQLDTLKLMLAYRDGLPVQRKEEIKATVRTDEDVMNRLAKKPAYRDVMLEFILSLKDRDIREKVATGSVVGEDEE